MKPTITKKEVKTILKQIRIDGDTRFTIKDKSYLVANQAPYMKWNRPIGSFGANPGDDNHLRANLVRELGSKIYSIYYVHGDPQGGPEELLHNFPQEERNAFMDTLSQANKTREGWDQWWSVVSVGGHGTPSSRGPQVTVQKNGEFRNLVPNEWRPANPQQGPLAPGAMVHLLIKKENRQLQPVFYHVHAEHFLPQNASLGRFYMNLKPEGAAELITGITSRLNRFSIPFSFKCMNHPESFTRTDNAVLYIQKHHFAVVARLLREIVSQLRVPLNEKVPMFSHKIIPGLSYAEDPGDGKSFGMFWSEVLAEGVVKAHERNQRNIESILATVLAVCESRGVSLDESFRKANSYVEYDFGLITAPVS